MCVNVCETGEGTIPGVQREMSQQLLQPSGSLEEKRRAFDASSVAGTDFPLHTHTHSS